MGVRGCVVKEESVLNKILTIGYGTVHVLVLRMFNWVHWRTVVEKYIVANMDTSYSTSFNMLPDT